MCGICGIFNRDNKPVERSLVQAMNKTLVHRGPDDDGFHVEGPVGLGQRRLSIIDLNTGKQPIYNEDQSKAIVFNGEIYNFQNLRKQLLTTGHVFKTQTDTEVIVHAYEQWGKSCVNKLRGMFAFAIWDASNQSIFLARDRLGIKPLYYSLDNSTLAFASEIKALLKVPELSRDLDLEALSDYLSLGYVPGSKSIFKSIRKLPAGHTLLCSRDRDDLREYWDLSFEPDEQITEDEWCDRIREQLHDAVNLRLISDVPLGAFLSGGIDSSVIVALMAGLCKGPVITSSVGFTLEKYSELEFARKTASFFHTDHHEYTVSPDAVEVVEKLSWYFDEPFADSSALPTYYVSKIARQNVTVCLSGDGGDENFAGYRRYFYDRLENQVRSLLPAWFRRYIVGSLGDMYPKADWLPQPFRAKTLLSNIATDPAEAYFCSMSHFLPRMKQAILSDEMRTELREYDTCNIFREHYAHCSSQDPLSRTQYVDFKTYLVDDILTKVDRASMANSLEVRVPLLDHHLVELAAQIPSTLKLKGRSSKHIFKKLARSILPEEIVNREKMGFIMPVTEWLRKDLRPLVEDTLLNKHFSERGLFRQEYVHRLWNQHLSGMRDQTQPLWALLMFELWARKFSDQ